MNATLESLAAAIFKSWFVDFDPVRAKMDGRQPVGMDEETARLFPDKFADSEIGLAPVGWTICPISDAFQINPKRSLTKNSVAKYLDMKNVPTQGHRPDGVVDREFKSGTKFTNGDTLPARITPCLENGKTAFVDFLADGEAAWGSTEFIILRPKPPLPPEFAYFLARHPEFRLHAIQNMTGASGRQRVHVDCFKQYSVAVPNKPVAELFSNSATPLMAKSKNGSEENTTLAALRDTLLPKLLSGELRVSDAERVVEAAV